MYIFPFKTILFFILIFKNRNSIIISIWIKSVKFIFFYKKKFIIFSLNIIFFNMLNIKKNLFYFYIKIYNSREIIIYINMVEKIKL